MAATPSIKVFKTMPWRGGTRTYSNRYHFNGGTPADSSHWTTFADAVAADEAASLPDSTHVVEIIGYEAGSDLPVFSKAYSTVGGASTASWEPCPGECAALVKYQTTARTSKNHPVYLFNYYHPAYVAPGGPGDTLVSGLKTNLDEYVADWLAGFSDGTNTYVRAGPNGATAISGSTETLITHRDFPR